MDAKKKKLLTYVGLGLAAVAIIYVVLRNRTAQSNAPLAQYAAAVLPGGGGGYGWTGGSGGSSENLGSPPPPAYTGPPGAGGSAAYQPGVYAGAYSQSAPFLVPYLTPGGAHFGSGQSIAPPGSIADKTLNFAGGPPHRPSGVPTSGGGVGGAGAPHGLGAVPIARGGGAPTLTDYAINSHIATTSIVHANVPRISPRV